MLSRSAGWRAKDVDSPFTSEPVKLIQRGGFDGDHGQESHSVLSKSTLSRKSFASRKVQRYGFLGIEFRLRGVVSLRVTQPLYAKSPSRALSSVTVSYVIVNRFFMLARFSLKRFFLHSFVWMPGSYRLPAHQRKNLW